MHRLLSLMLPSLLILGAAGCGDTGPGTTDLTGDSGNDVLEDTVPADTGGNDDVIRDVPGDLPPDPGGDETPVDIKGDTSDVLIATDATDAADPADGMDAADLDVAVDGQDAVDQPDAGDTADDVQTADSIDDAQPSDTNDDTGDTGVADTSEPESIIQVFTGYSAAAGSSVSRDYSLGFTMGAGRFEFSAAGGDYILDPSMCVVK